MKTARLIIASIVLCAPMVLMGGTTGKIAGRVTDAKSGEPLVGANVLLMGTSFGASSRVDGSYVILNIPPGVYDLRFTLVGFGTTLVTAVRVSTDQTTTVDRTLDAASVGMAEIVVEAVTNGAAGRHSKHRRYQQRADQDHAGEGLRRGAADAGRCCG